MKANPETSINRPRTDQEDVGDDLYEFLTQWFTVFEEYKENDFFAFGESYAGNSNVATLGNSGFNLQSVSKVNMCRPLARKSTTRTNRQTSRSTSRVSE